MKEFKDYVIRVTNLKLVNFKNIGEGTIALNGGHYSIDKGDILGVYGQNGSGKTSMVVAFDLLKSLLVDYKFNHSINNYVKKGNDQATCEFEFVIYDKDILKYKVRYGFAIEEKSKKELTDNGVEKQVDFIQVVSESLYYHIYDNKQSKFLNKKKFLGYELDVIKPANKFKSIFNNDKQLELDFLVEKNLSLKTGKSFFFSNDFFKMIDNLNIDNVERDILKSLKLFGTYYLHVYTNKELSLINANILLPIDIVDNNDIEITRLNGSLKLSEPSLMNDEVLESCNKAIDTVNCILPFMIPDLRIKLKVVDKEFNEINEVVNKVELITFNTKYELPLKYESDGIKKIISILFSYSRLFTDSCTTLVIDEFDSGVFEFLLGQILKATKEVSKGQFVFTSHNLRALEVLGNENIIFTTTNENERFIKFKNIKSNNNLRNVYYQTIILGGKSEQIYHKTSDVKLSRAFRMLGYKDEA